jgi:hypothetical protein
MDIPPFIDVVTAAALAAVALALRLALHLTGNPGGIDTWYFLASADALRQSRRLPVHLPRYLLHDGPESYPPGFIILLALLPAEWRRRGFWLISPIIDVAHLLLLYAVTRRLTGSRELAMLAGLVYALTPQLISETRNLNPRAFGALLHSIAILFVLAATVPGLEPRSVLAWSAAAVVAAAALLLTHASSSATFGVAIVGLTLINRDWRYAAVAAAAAALVFTVAPKLSRSTLRNYTQAAAFWRRNLAYRGADEVANSPIYGGRGETVRGGRWQSGRLAPAVRLLGENPFVLPLIGAALVGAPWQHWTGGMLVWAGSIWVWATAVTAMRSLHSLGPGFLYLKTVVFPTAFITAAATGPFVGTATVVAALAAAAGIAVFFRHVWSRRTQHTAWTPPDLANLVSELARLQGDGVLCLPWMYADYVVYHSGKSVLWGGHSGDLTRFESLSPVIRRPLDELVKKYRLTWALFDLAYTQPDRVGLGAVLSLAARHGQFALYRVSDGEPALS